MRSGRGIDGDLVLIQLNGETGFGKTRLLDELARELDGRPRSAGRCAPRSNSTCRTCRSPALCAMRARARPGTSSATRRSAGSSRSSTSVHRPPRHRRRRRARSARRPRGRSRAAGAARRRSPVGRPEHDRGAELPAKPPARSARRGGPRPFGRRPRRPITASGSLTPDLVIDLEPLDADDVDQLGIPNLYETTGGNPRFVAEAMRTGERRRRRASPKR